MTPESQIHIKKWRVLERAYMKESQDSNVMNNRTSFCLRQAGKFLELVGHQKAGSLKQIPANALPTCRTKT